MKVIFECFTAFYLWDKLTWNTSGVGVRCGVKPGDTEASVLSMTLVTPTRWTKLHVHFTNIGHKFIGQYRTNYLSLPVRQTIFAMMQDF